MTIMASQTKYLRLFTLLAVVALASCRHSTTTTNTSTPSPTIAEKTSIKLTSSTFNDGELIPRKYTYDGEDVSPPLHWSGVPASTKALVLVVDDPDAPGGTWVHWLVYDLPPELTSLPENIASAMEHAGSAKQGMNDFRKIGYGGPCPPSGMHRYYFKLYALDAKPSLNNPGTSKDEVLKQLAGHTIAQGELMGRYKR